MISSYIRVIFIVPNIYCLITIWIYKYILISTIINNNIVEITYIVTSGTVTNGAKSFVFNGTITDGDGNLLNTPF